MRSDIHYARDADGHAVAYRVLGDGPLNLVFIPDWVTNLEVLEEEPTIARFFERLASFSRLILFDKRGSGLSDPVPLGAVPTPEVWMDDVASVLDALGLESAALFGHGEGGSMAILHAATHPRRTTSLVLADTFARRVRAPDYPAGMPAEAAERYIDAMLRTWGTGLAGSEGGGEQGRNARFISVRARLERLAMSPGMFAAMYPCTYQHDVRPLLSAIQVPTLVLHRKDNPYVRAANGQFLAEHIAGARYVGIEGREHLFHCGETGAMLDAVEEFLTGTRASTGFDRELATVLFTDIVDSTSHARRLGDRLWSELLATHHGLVREQLRRFRGREMDTAGDGFFATFDGPGRGVRCALAIREALQPLGLQIRAGLHTGEVELLSEKVGGIAVHIGARVAGRAEPGEVLVSRTVRDLVAGSGLEFTERGRHALEGVGGEWELFRASALGREGFSR